MNIKIAFYLPLFFFNVYASSITSRIIGGIPAFAGQFPYITAITKTTNDGNYFCGGALLSNLWVLTSGHCVVDSIVITVRVGLIKIKDDPNELKLATEDYVVHPDFNPNTLEHDVGLIKFRLPITLTGYIQPIHHLPSENLSLSNTAGIMTMGWGQTSDSSSALSEKLYYVYLVPLDNDECRQYYGNQVFDTMVCAAGRFNEGFCYGDTGTPLVQYNDDTITTHLAIASFVSQNGCEFPSPSGYTRTFPYVTWIKNVTELVSEPSLMLKYLNF